MGLCHASSCCSLLKGIVLNGFYNSLHFSHCHPKSSYSLLISVFIINNSTSLVCESATIVQLQIEKFHLKSRKTERLQDAWLNWNRFFFVLFSSIQQKSFHFYLVLQTQTDPKIWLLFLLPILKIKFTHSNNSSEIGVEKKRLRCFSVVFYIFLHPFMLLGTVTTLIVSIRIVVVVV